MNSGTYTVEFSGDNNVDVMIRDDESFGGFLGMMGGGGVCCFGILFLIIGGILATTMKDKPKVQATIQIDNEMVVVQDESNEKWYDQDDST